MEKATTREIVKEYHEHRSGGAFSLVSALLAKDFSFASPLMRFNSAKEHVAALVDFHQIVVGYDMISELYGDGEATLVYDLRTATPVGTQRTAEYFRLSRDKIESIILIFDATPWRPIMEALTQSRTSPFIE